MLLPILLSPKRVIKERVAAKAPKMEDTLFLKPNCRSDFPSFLFYLFFRSESLNPPTLKGMGLYKDYECQEVGIIEGHVKVCLPQL